MICRPNLSPNFHQFVGLLMTCVAIQGDQSRSTPQRRSLLADKAATPDDLPQRTARILIINSTWRLTPSGAHSVSWLAPLIKRGLTFRILELIGLPAWCIVVLSYYEMLHDGSENERRATGLLIVDKYV